MKVEPTADSPVLAAAQINLNVRPLKSEGLGQKRPHGDIQVRCIGSSPVQVPKAQIDVEVGTLAHGLIDKLLNTPEINPGILILEIVLETLQGKTDLPDNGTQQLHWSVTGHQDTVGDNVDRHTNSLTRIDDSRKFRVTKGLSQKVQDDFLSQRRQLLNNTLKISHTHHLLLPLACRAKGTLQVADIADFDVDPLKTRLGHGLKNLRSVKGSRYNSKGIYARAENDNIRERRPVPFPEQLASVQNGPSPDSMHHRSYCLHAKT